MSISSTSAVPFSRDGSLQIDDSNRAFDATEKNSRIAAGSSLFDDSAGLQSQFIALGEVDSSPEWKSRTLGGSKVGFCVANHDDSLHAGYAIFTDALSSHAAGIRTVQHVLHDGCVRVDRDDERDECFDGAFGARAARTWRIPSSAFGVASRNERCSSRICSGDAFANGCDVLFAGGLGFSAPVDTVAVVGFHDDDDSATHGGVVRAMHDLRVASLYSGGQTNGTITSFVMMAMLAGAFLFAKQITLNWSIILFCVAIFLTLPFVIKVLSRLLTSKKLARRSHWMSIRLSPMRLHSSFDVDIVLDVDDSRFDVFASERRSLDRIAFLQGSDRTWVLCRSDW